MILQYISMCVIGGWIQAGLADTQEDIDRIKLLLDEAITEGLITEEKVDLFIVRGFFREAAKQKSPNRRPEGWRLPTSLRR